MQADLLLSLAGATLRTTAPLLAACLAGLWSEKAGIVNVALEGKMLAAAFAAAACASLTGQATAGLAAGLAAAVLLALLHGYMAVDRKADQIVSGMAINLIAAGATALAGSALFGEGGRTPSLEGAARILPMGGIGLEPLALAIYAAVPLTALILRQSLFGLRVEAAGENPQALVASGASLRRTRYGALVVCGLLAGLAGSDLSLSLAAGFLPGMSAGKGFVALAALVLAGWRPWRALAACLLFGALDAVAIRFQGLVIPGLPAVPIQFVQAMPYILTLVLLGGFVGRARPPAAAASPTRPGDDMTDLDTLLSKARDAMAKAYAPYSRFPVGVALRAESGRIHIGCNVENAAFPSGTCAEAGAIASMIVAGDSRIIDLVVVGNGDAVTPCGACRQRISEFADARTRIHCAGADGIRSSHGMSDLLPHAFGPDNVLRGPPSEEA